MISKIRITTNKDNIVNTYTPYYYTIGQMDYIESVGLMIRITGMILKQDITQYIAEEVLI